MFKFNFDVSNDIQITKNVESEGEIKEKSHLIWYDCEEIIQNINLASKIDFYKLNSNVLNIQNYNIYHVQYDKQIKLLDGVTGDIKNADANHSDLIPAVYEGGGKIWECTIDLLNYLITSKIISNANSRFVLDLGCGAGLLGILALLNQANVHFQDYNKDVLETITIPNCLINLPDQPAAARFFSGDWLNYTEKTKNLNKFDLILTSETIYNPVNQKKLLNTLASKLKPNGLILLAAKTYYFGVGGGLRAFEKLILEDDRFQSDVVWKSTIGISREILEIKFKI